MQPQFLSWYGIFGSSGSIKCNVCIMNSQVSLPMLYAGASTDIGVESVEGLEVTDIAKVY